MQFIYSSQLKVISQLGWFKYLKLGIYLSFVTFLMFSLYLIKIYKYKKCVIPTNIMKIDENSLLIFFISKTYFGIENREFGNNSLLLTKLHYIWKESYINKLFGSSINTNEVTSFHFPF